jgi:hypothetical protein
MDVKRIDNSQSFQALNYECVAKSDRLHLYKHLKELKKLGERYNIRLISTFADAPGFSAIDVNVTPLKKGLSFWQKIFPPIGRSTFKAPQTPSVNNPNNLLNSVQKAIKNLTDKMEHRNIV